MNRTAAFPRECGFFFHYLHHFILENALMAAVFRLLFSSRGVIILKNLKDDIRI